MNTATYAGDSIDPGVSAWVRKHRAEYPYFVELSSKFRIGQFAVWANEHLPKRMQTITANALCEPTRVCLAAYCLLPLSRMVSMSNYLVGFVTPEDRARAIEHLREFVVHENPFPTEL